MKLKKKKKKFVEFEFHLNIFIVELEFHLNIFKELKFNELEFHTRNSSSLNGTRVPQIFIYLFIFKFHFAIIRLSKNRVLQGHITK